MGTLASVIHLTAAVRHRLRGTATLSRAAMKLFGRSPPTRRELADALGQCGSEEMIAEARQLLTMESAFGRITERHYLMHEANSAERLAFYTLCRCIHRESWAARKRALRGLSTLLTPLNGVRIDPRAGFAIADACRWGLVNRAVDEARFCFARAVAAQLPDRADLSTLAIPSPKPLMSSHLMRLARQRAMLRVVGDYLGGLPILLGIRLACADDHSTQNASSQSYHIDADDFRQVKAFLIVNDIDAETGPLHLIRADDSEEIQVRTDYRLSEPLVDEATVYANGARPTICTGRWGTLVFADTSRCFHMEKHPEANRRCVAVFDYVTPASPLFRIGERNFERKITKAAAAAGMDRPIDRLLFGMRR